MTDWTHAPAHAIAAAVRAGDVKAAEVTEAHLDLIARRNGPLNAFTDITADRARAAAARIDALRQEGYTLPALAGVPFAAKNLFDIDGLVTRAGAKINRDRPPATADATLVQRMESAGAVLLGALNMGEYAYDFTGRNAHDGHARNPHDPERMSGGSSSGSGVAAAAGMAAITLGSDTNGSIRVPASFCGLFGLKPTYGGLSRAGTFPFVASLDHVGPLARSTLDLALAVDAMSGPDGRDPVCRRTAQPALTPSLSAGLNGLRIARAGGYFERLLSDDARHAVDRVCAQLDVKASIDLPETARARAAAFLITMAESAALHLERLKTRAQDFDPEVRDRLLAGAMLPASFVQKAQVFRRWYHAQCLAAFAEVDVLVAPATPTTAPHLDQTVLNLDGQTLPVRANIGIHTQPISFVGLPVVCVPTWTQGALPIGVQLIAAPGREDHALRVAQVLEETRVARAPVATQTH